MRVIKLFIPLVLSISLMLPVNPIKSFNHKSDKNLVLQHKIHDEFFDKISYLQE